MHAACLAMSATTRALRSTPGVKFLLALAVGADSRDELTGPDVVSRHEHLPGGRARDADIAVWKRAGKVADRSIAMAHSEPISSTNFRELLRIAIISKHAAERTDEGHRAKMCAALGSAAADQEGVRIRARKMPGRNGARGRRAQYRDLDRIEKREQPPGRRVEQGDQSLNRRQSTKLRVAREVRIDFRGVVAGLPPIAAVLT